MQKPANPTPDSITCAGITWTKFDMRLAGASEPEFEFNADGEGIFIIKEEVEGFFLYHDGFLVAALGSLLPAAVEKATSHMQTTNPVLCQSLRAKGGEGSA